MRSLFASHPDYEILNDLSQKIAWAKNPQMLFHGSREIGITMPERKAIVSTLELTMREHLRGGRFKDFINSIDFDL